MTELDKNDKLPLIMSCEFIGTKTCPFSEAVSNVKQALGAAAEGSPVKEQREVVCLDTSRDIRLQGCPTYQMHRGRL